MQLSIKTNIDDVAKSLTKIQRKQIPFAASVALNETAFGLQKEIKRQMPRKLDRPTPWTIAGVRVQKSKKTDLEAIVYMAGAKGLKGESADRNKYMQYQVYGGTRMPKKSKIPVPYQKNLKTNKYGNLPRNKIKGLTARPDVFVGNVKGIDGVWQRNKKNNGVKLLVGFENSAQYSGRFPFGRIGSGYSLSKFDSNFNKALARALASAR